jgi:two-component system, NtrC family, response regulator AtoC
VDQQTTEQRRPRWDQPSEEHGAFFSLLVVCAGVISTYPLEPGQRLLMGRAKHAHIRVDHASVSREHAALSVGEHVTLEDLGSANGTRIRGQALRPGAAVPIAVGDVIDLGDVLLVVQARRLEQRLNRVCSPAFFELSLEEEAERSRGAAAGVGVAQLDVAGELGARAVELLLASELGARDLVCSPKPNRYQLMFLDRESTGAEARLARMMEILSARGLSVRARLTLQPRDGDDARALLGRAEAAPVLAHDVAKYAPLIVEDQAMLRVCRLLERVAQSELSVILLGETGTGKEMCAQLLHRASKRAKARLLCLNCAALPESLLESELFGHERGAFTGATHDKLGLLEAAGGGSVFLDEIGDMPLATQIKLLRVLEAKEVLRIGSRSPRPLDVRVIAATNRDLQERITAGFFREDLFYRLNGISVLVPPLRERPADIIPLARSFVARATGDGNPPRLSDASLVFLSAQRWSGNVRELKNAVERALVLCDGPSIEPPHLRESVGSVAVRPEPDGLRAEVEALERQRIEQALRDAGGSQRRAAALLGISRGALLRRLSQYKLLGARPRRRE